MASRILCSAQELWWLRIAWPPCLSPAGHFAFAGAGYRRREVSARRSVKLMITPCSTRSFGAVMGTESLRQLR